MIEVNKCTEDPQGKDVLGENVAILVIQLYIHLENSKFSQILERNPCEELAPVIDTNRKSHLKNKQKIK